MKAEIVIANNSIRILINGYIHLLVKEDEFLGFQSWIENKRKFFIEIYLKNGKILLGYDVREKWELILKLLNENL